MAKLRMELTDKGVEIEYGGKTEVRQERKYRVVVDDQGVMVEAKPES